MWFDNVIKGLNDGQLINDSKTPSGTVHVGSLRGVLIHDAVYRALLNQHIEVKYSFGIDDYDPMDGLPVEAGDELKQWMGVPLCNIPAPAHSKASDIAEYYIQDFLDIFTQLGVNANVYRMRDIYRSGQFNEAIDTILRNVDKVREIYAKISKADKSDKWYPFQVICENCGKIGSTEVIGYDGKVVQYQCHPSMVSWAQGCGHQGAISPFDGKGKLPWKLEWVAKWHVFGITIEGAGKDHCTKGGSRDVASACLRAIFNERPPLNVPYEFFLVSGKKMSSSKGVGNTAREMANFLPEEILRFLMIRSPAKRTVNFSTDLEYIVKLFNEYDKLVELNRSGKASEDQKKTYAMTQVNNLSSAYHPVGFQLLSALLQLPHIEVISEINKRLPDLSDKDSKALEKRIKSAQYWLDNYALAEDKLELQAQMPASATSLGNTQKAFLHELGQCFPKERLSGDEYQRYIFTIARKVPIQQKAAFSAIYRVLFDAEQGPKGGPLFSYLESDFLRQRFSEVSYDKVQLLQTVCLSLDDLLTWINKMESKIVAIDIQDNVIYQAELVAIYGFLLMITSKDNKRFTQHLLVNAELTELNMIQEAVEIRRDELKTALAPFNFTIQFV